MSDRPEILEKWTHSTMYGKSFSVLVRQPEGGTAYVAEVEVEGWPPFQQPIEESFESMQDAADAGIRFAVSQISD